MAKLISMDEMKPCVDLNSKDFPEIKGWDVGKDYTVSLNLHIKRKSQGGYGVPDTQISITAEISSEKEEKKETKTEKEQESKTDDNKSTTTTGSFLRAAGKV